MYEVAHQEVIANWDRKKLCEEISTLERKHSHLLDVLARIDPEVYLQKLQSEMIKLQVVNKSLKEEKAKLAPSLPDSSTKENEANESQNAETVGESDESGSGSGSSSSSDSDSSSSSSSSGDDSDEENDATMDGLQSPESESKEPSGSTKAVDSVEGPEKVSSEPEGSGESDEKLSSGNGQEEERTQD